LKVEYLHITIAVDLHIKAATWGPFEAEYLAYTLQLLFGAPLTAQ